MDIANARECRISRSDRSLIILKRKSSLRYRLEACVLSNLVAWHGDRVHASLAGEIVVWPKCPCIQHEVPHGNAGAHSSLPLIDQLDCVYSQAI